jgi:hypothetical protein
MSKDRRYSEQQFDELVSSVLDELPIEFRHALERAGAADHAGRSLTRAAARAQARESAVDSYTADAVADDEHDEAAQDRAENDECRRAAREH